MRQQHARGQRHRRGRREWQWPRGLARCTCRVRRPEKRTAQRPRGREQPSCSCSVRGWTGGRCGGGRPQLACLIGLRSRTRTVSRKSRARLCRCSMACTARAAARTCRPSHAFEGAAWLAHELAARAQPDPLWQHEPRTPAVGCTSCWARLRLPHVPHARAACHAQSGMQQPRGPVLAAGPCRRKECCTHKSVAFASPTRLPPVGAPAGRPAGTTAVRAACGGAAGAAGGCSMPAILASHTIM